MAVKIATIRRETENLKAISGGIPVVDRNADRLLSSVMTREINIRDMAEFL